MTASRSDPVVAARGRSSIAARTLATWFTLIATVACVFLARALIARVLGPAGIGLFALMLTAAWLAGTVLSAGLPAYNASFATKVSPAVLLSNSIAWNAVASVIVAAVCIPALISATVPLTWKIMILGVVMAPVMALLESTRGVFQGLSAMVPYNWLGLSAGALNLGAIAGLTLTSRLTLKTAVVCWMVSTMITAVAAVKLAASHAGGLGSLDRRVLFGSLKFGGQAWLSQLTGILNFRIGLLLTEALLGTVAVGIYAVAVTIGEVLFYFPNALAIVSSARYATASPSQARILLTRSAVWVLGMSSATAVAIAVTAGPVIHMAFGSSYDESARVLVILLPGVVAFTPTAVVTWYFNAHLQKPLLNLVIAGSSAFINSVLTLVWAPDYGLTGVAWATTSAYLAASLLALALVRRESGTS